MIVAHVFNTKREAVQSLYQFICTYSNSICKIDKPRLIITLQNGDLHYFMNERQYEIWCLGKTYQIEDRYYHSGYEVSEDY